MARNRNQKKTTAAAKTATAPAVGATKPKKSADKVKAQVLFDRHSWVDENGAIRRAKKNEVIEVTAEEFARGKELGSLAKPGKDAEQALEPKETELTTPGGDPVDEPVTDELLNGAE